MFLVCAANKYFDASSSTCIDCPPDSTSEAGSIICSEYFNQPNLIYVLC